MNEIEELLVGVEPLSVAVADDVARGERALGRRRRRGAAIVGVAAAAVVGAGGLVHSVDHGSAVASGPGDVTYVGSASATKGHHVTGRHQKKQPQKRQHHQAAHHKAAKNKATTDQTGGDNQTSSGVCPPPSGTYTEEEYQATPCVKGVLEFVRQARTTDHDVIADHLAEADQNLAPVEWTGGGVGNDRVTAFLNWGGGYQHSGAGSGFIEVTVTRNWDDGLHPTQSEPGIQLKSTTYHGQEARVGSKDGFLLVQLKHADGTVVTMDTARLLDASADSVYGGITSDQLLAAAADGRLVMPDSVPTYSPLYGPVFISR